MVTTKQYTFSNVQANHTIAAEFEADNWLLDIKPATIAVAGACQFRYKIGSGSWASLGNLTTTGITIPVPVGQSIQVECINISAGSQFGYWKRTGSLTTDSSDNPITVTQDQGVTSITAYLNAVTYTITASAGSNGSISPSGSLTVAHGNSQTFTINANSGYRIKQILVDGSPIQL